MAFGHPARPRHRERYRRPLVERLDARRLLMADAASTLVEPESPPALVAAAVATNSVHFKFDYRYDNGYFSGNNLYRRDLLDLAGRYFTDRLGDTLAAVPMSLGGCQATLQIRDPSTNAVVTLPSNFGVANNEIVVFPGARNLGSISTNTRAIATVGLAGGSIANCPSQAALDAYNTLITTRGEPGAAASPPTDFAPFVATLAFDNRLETINNWTDESVADHTNKFRFVSFAMHELAHVLGFGTSPSWTAGISGGTFARPATTAAYVGQGGVPLTPDLGHVATSVASLQPTILTAFIPNTLASTLDFAILDDIGWELGADTRPTLRVTASANTVQESAGSVTVTATLSSALATPLTIPITRGGTASLGSDANLSSTQFVFGANQTTASITVQIVDNTVDEAIETLSLSFGTNIAVKSEPVVPPIEIAIFDDDGAPPATTKTVSPTFTGSEGFGFGPAPFSVAGDNQPFAILFRASVDTVLTVTALDAAALTEPYSLIDQRLVPIGTYQSPSVLTANLTRGQSYALLFQSRAAAARFQITSSAGFGAINNAAAVNVILPADVTGDGMVTALDALRIINQLNRSNAASVAIDAPELEKGNYFDVSGNGEISALDALRVINFLNEQAAAGARVSPGGLAAAGERVTSIPASTDAVMATWPVDDLTWQERRDDESLGRVF